MAYQIVAVTTEAGVRTGFRGAADQHHAFLTGHISLVTPTQDPAVAQRQTLASRLVPRAVT
jgi:hypothetical protein